MDPPLSEEREDVEETDDEERTGNMEEIDDVERDKVVVPELLS